MRFNEIAIQATARMNADKDTIGLSRSCPYEIIVYSVPKHINTTRMHTIS